MASKKKPANFKVTKSKNKVMTAALIGLATALIVIVIGVILLHANQTSDKTFQTVENVDGGSVNLGSLGFRIEGDKLVIRNDSVTQEVRYFLKAETKKIRLQGQQRRNYGNCPFPGRETIVIGLWLRQF